MLIAGLVCPQTKQPLEPLPLAEADRRVAGGRLEPSRGGAALFGRTPTLLLRDDALCAYAIADGLPVLLVPERLVPVGRADTGALPKRYARSYREMRYYNRVSERQLEDVAETGAGRRLRRARALAPSPALFPHPVDVWLGSAHETTAQFEAYRHVAPLEGKRVLQIGGGGTHALAFLLAGAELAWLVTPMIDELRFARELASLLGLSERFVGVLGLAEELPFASQTLDVVYAQGSLHHVATDGALLECARVLRPGGAFASVDPWRTPIYRIGTAILGKNEPEVSCQPLTRARVGPAYEAFADVRVSRHGALTRYTFVLLRRLGITVGVRRAWRLARLDDRIAAAIPPLRPFASSVVVRARVALTASSR